MPMSASLIVLNGLALHLAGWSPSPGDIIQADFESRYLSAPEFRAGMETPIPGPRDAEGVWTVGCPAYRSACAEPFGPPILQPSGFSERLPGAASTR
jgi:hypothetical protein